MDYTKKVLCDDSTRTPIYSIPQLVRTERRQLETCVNHLMAQDALKIKQIVLSGCGYSLAACMIGKHAIEQLAQIPVQVSQSVDLSRHQSMKQYELESVLAIGVSSSGIVGRIAEYLHRFRNLGAMTLCLSSDQNSKCALEAESFLDISSPNIGRGIPLRPYIMTILSFYEIGWTLAIAKGLKDYDQKKEWDSQIDCLMGDLENQLPSIEERIEQYSLSAQGASGFEFVGAGPGYACAWLGRQEFLGRNGTPACDVGVEDWFHSAVFLRSPQDIATMLFVPTNSPSFSRLSEARKYMRTLGRRLLVVSDVTDGDDVLIVPYSHQELLNPLVDSIVPSFWSGCMRSLGYRPASDSSLWDFCIDGYATEFTERKFIG